MKDRAVYYRILKLVKPHMGLIIFSLVMAVVNVLATLYIPILTGNAVDCMVDRGIVDFARIKTILLTFLVTLIINGISNFLMTLSNNRVTFKIVHDMRETLLKKIHSVPVSYLDAKGHGEILSRTISDVERLSDGLLLGFSQLFTGILTIIGTLVFMFVTNGLISLVVVVLTHLSLFAASFISKKTYKHFSKQAKLQGEMTGFINESINSTKLITAFGAQAQRESRFNEMNENYAKVNLKALFFSSITNPVTRFVNGLVYASVGIFGALLGIAGKLPIN